MAEFVLKREVCVFLESKRLSEKLAHFKSPLMLCARRYPTYEKNSTPRPENRKYLKELQSVINGAMKTQYPSGIKASQSILNSHLTLFVILTCILIGKMKLLTLNQSK